MRVIGSGEHIAPIVYGDDVAECAIECSCHPRAVGEVFNIVSDDNVTWRQFLEMLAFHLGTRLPRFGIPYGFIYPAAAVMEFAWRLAHARYPPPATRFGLRLFASDWRSDSQKARKVIGFSPKISYIEGSKATMEWIRTGWLRGKPLVRRDRRVGHSLRQPRITTSSMIRVLVTGGAGFIGSHLIETLLT